MMEVLAPVGNIQSLKAAIYAGADAVYLGLDMFNARIKAGNFTKDNIAEYVSYCHMFGVKVYVTFNTSVKESEMESFAQYVDIAAKAKVDAFIVTDLGTLEIFKNYDVPIHGSTQIGVHNLAGAKVLEELGFTRVVLARETLKEDILQIKNNTSLEIEHFVHGALCVCFSGACLMSSMMSGDSGNRGRCNQPCRLKYSSDFSDRSKYLLSPKDQCLIDKLDDLQAMGVDSLKIEGRLKQPHYVGSVVKEYRKAVDAILGGKKEDIDYSALKRAYNRGNFTSGYNYEQSEMIMYGDVNGNIGERVGKVVGCENKILKMRLNFPLFDGDGVKIIKDGLELGGFAIKNVRESGGLHIVECNDRFPIGANIHLTLQKSQVDKYDNVNPKLSIDFDLTAIAGEKLILNATCGDINVSVDGAVAERALNNCASKESVAEQLLRLGDTCFSADLDKITVNIDEGRPCFIPRSVLNSMRRECVEKMKRALIERYETLRQHAVLSLNSESNIENIRAAKSLNFVEIDADNCDLISTLRLKSKINLVIKFSDKLAENLNIILKNNLIKNKIEGIYLKLPRVARGMDYNSIRQKLYDYSNLYDGIIADNLYGVYLAKQLGKILIGGIGLNIYNSNYSDILGLDGFLNSVELNNKELIEGGLIYSFGYLPIMTLLHCPIRINTGCKCSDCKYDGKFSYYDKRGKYMIRRFKINYCQFELYNQQIVDIRNKLSKIDGAYYLDFSNYDCGDINTIIDNFIEKSGSSVDNATYGHLFRGVK